MNGFKFLIFFNNNPCDQRMLFKEDTMMAINCKLHKDVQIDGCATPTVFSSYFRGREKKKEKKNERLATSNLTPHGYVVDTLIHQFRKT